jgi:hypothetical protein
MILKAHRILGWCSDAKKIDDFVSLIRKLEAVTQVSEITEAASGLLRK